MSHLDEATVVALRDGETVQDDEHRHGHECPACREALALSRERARSIEDVLSGVDLEVDVEAAKTVVRARLDAHHTRVRRLPFGSRGLRRAAAILLLTAGGAYAFPRTPLPGWLGVDGPAAPDVASEVPGQETSTAAGVEIGVVDRLDIVLNSMPPGDEVEVAWHDGRAARLNAGAGATYSVGEGRAEASVAAGPVVVELPRAAPMISITINGRMVFEGTFAASEVSDVGRRLEDGLVFVAPRR